MTAHRVAGLPFVALLIAAGSPLPISAAGRAIDVHQSHVTVLVSKAGPFSAFADDHTITAPVADGAISDLPPLSVRIEVDAGQLTVLDPKLSPDKRRDVRARMLSADVLDAARFPTIAFESTSVEPSGDNRWLVSGRLTMHGVTRNVTFTTARMNGRYRGEVKLRQHDFGITPIRIAGGAVKVKDEVTVQFEIAPVEIQPAPLEAEELFR